jgi:hypothetical protein
MLNIFHFYDSEYIYGNFKCPSRDSACYCRLSIQMVTRIFIRNLLSLNNTVLYSI